MFSNQMRGALTPPEFGLSYLNTKVPAVPWPSTSNGAKEILPTCNSSLLPPAQRGDVEESRKKLSKSCRLRVRIQCNLRHVTCCTFGITGDVSICDCGAAAAVTVRPRGKVRWRTLSVWEWESNVCHLSAGTFSAVNFISGINHAFGIDGLCEKCCLNWTLACQ